MRTIPALLALIGLQFTMGCKVTNNYYSIYPTKVVECDHRPISFEWDNPVLTPWDGDPGFYKPQNTLEWHTVPGYTLNDLDLRFDTAQVSEDYYLFFDQDTIK